MGSSNIEKALQWLDEPPQERTTEDVAAWFDATIDAELWFSFKSVNPTKAAICLSGFNPRSPESEAWLDTTTISETPDEHRRLRTTTPDDHRRLLDVFECVGGERSLTEWIRIAKERRLKYHGWVDAYIKAVGIGVVDGTTAPKPVADAQPECAAVVQAVPAAVDNVPNLDKSLTTAQIATVFDGIGYTAESWPNRLSGAKWAENSRIARGARGGATSLWNPLLLAQALHSRKGTHDERTGVLDKLNKAFKQKPMLAPWKDQWAEFALMFSDDDLRC